MKLRKGDKVVVLTGKDRGKEGEIVRVYPEKNRVLVEGVNMVKKHQKAGHQTVSYTHLTLPTIYSV